MDDKILNLAFCEAYFFFSEMVTHGSEHDLAREGLVSKFYFKSEEELQRRLARYIGMGLVLLV